MDLFDKLTITDCCNFLIIVLVITYILRERERFYREFKSLNLLIISFNDIIL